MSRSSRTGLFALTFAGGDDRDCVIGGIWISLSADVAVVIENWSSWALMRFRGDGMVPQRYESE